MKFGTIFDENKPDGRLVMVSRDLKLAVYIPEIARTLQELIDHWFDRRVEAEMIYEKLNQRKITETFEFNTAQATAPLQRPHLWINSYAYPSFLSALYRVRGEIDKTSSQVKPVMYQTKPSRLCGPCESIFSYEEHAQLDFEGTLSAITTYDSSTKQNRICLLMLSNRVWSRAEWESEWEAGFGFQHSLRSVHCSSVAVTLDEVESDWQCKLPDLFVETYLNGALVGSPSISKDMQYSLAELVQWVSGNEPLSPGTVINTGPVSNKDHSTGFSSLIEKRFNELKQFGKTDQDFLKTGDRVLLQLLDGKGQSIFGHMTSHVVTADGIGSPKQLQ